MYRTMTDQEVEESNKELDEFWKNLDWNTKNHIKMLLDPYLEKVDCHHDYIDPNTYENNLDKNYLFCRKCHHKVKLPKNIDWDRDESISMGLGGDQYDDTTKWSHVTQQVNRKTPFK